MDGEGRPGGRTPRKAVSRCRAVRLPWRVHRPCAGLPCGVKVEATASCRGHMPTTTTQGSDRDPPAASAPCPVVDLPSTTCRDIIDGFPGLVWTTTLGLRLASLNGVAVAERGVDPASLVGRPLWEILSRESGCPEAHVATAVAQHEAALRGYPTRYDLTWLGCDWLVILRPLRSADGETTGVLGFATDVTDREVLRDKLHLSQRHFEAIFEHSLDAILLANEAGICVAVNPAACRLTGYTPEQLIGRSLAGIAPPARRDRFDETWRRFLDRGHLSGRYTLHTSDGQDIETEFQAVAHIVPGLHLSVMHDVTDRVRGEQALVQALDEASRAAARLREADQMKTAFLQAVSHELRTPLTNILGFAGTLQVHAHELDTSAAATMLERLMRNSERLSGLVSDLLDLDRMSRGILDPQPAPTDLGTLIARCLDAIDLVGREVYIVGPAAPPVVCNIDAPRTERILENLVTNAIKHTPTGTSIWVEYHAAADGGCRFSVRDDGPGIPEGVRPRIFEPFTQGDTPAARVGGAGIGLALADTFARIQGGHVTLLDGDREGTTFEVYLPGSMV